MLQPKKPVKKYVPTAKEKKNLKDATQMKNMRPTAPSSGRVKPTMGGAKNGKTMKKAQGGLNMLLPGGYAPKPRDEKYNTSPSIKAKPKAKAKPKSPIQEAIPEEIKKYGMRGSYEAKSGTSINKYQMGGFVSNEFAAKSSVKAKPKSKFIDSPIKTTRGKDINAFQGKKGMLAKSGAKMKKCKTGCK